MRGNCTRLHVLAWLNGRKLGRMPSKLFKRAHETSNSLLKRTWMTTANSLKGSSVHVILLKKFEIIATFHCTMKMAALATMTKRIM